MSLLTLKQHLTDAGEFIGLLRKHAPAIEAMKEHAKEDVPAAIEIADDFRALFEKKAEERSTEAARATAPTAPAPPPRIPAKAAKAHVAQHGLSEGERAIFERASQSIG